MSVNNVNNNTQVVNLSNSSVKNKKAAETSFDTYMQKTSCKTEEVSLNDIFEKAAKKYGVPVELLKAIGYTESNFRVDATSHCGAQGIMQLMPATAKSLGVTDAYDPEQNIMGGAKYISQMLKKYNGNISLALAAYNAGSGNVAKYGGIPPFKETQNYVVKVTQYMKQNLDADKKVVVSRKPDITASTNTTPIEENYTPDFNYNVPENAKTLSDKLDEIFSYDDYELLLKVLSQDEDSNEDQKNDYNTLSKLNMNPYLANLLKSASIK